MRTPGWLRRLDRVDVIVVLAMALVGIAFYFFRFGWAHFSPTSVDWLLSSEDPSTYYIGWTYFRQEPWGWPLGRIDGYLAPLGTSISMVDALPLVAIPLKLFDAWLPADFQYFGFWTCWSYALQSCFAYLLMGHVTRRRALRVVGALFFVTAPPLLLRHGHIALASHWLVLAALLAYLRLANAGLRERAAAWVLLVGTTSLVHPYLTVMVLGIAAAAWLRATGPAVWRHRVIGLGVLVALAGVALLGFWTTGMLMHTGDAPPETLGFGRYSMNLNSLYNPLGISSLLRDLPIREPAQWEGVNYAGAGLLVLALVAIAIVWARPRLLAVLGRHWTLAVVLLLFSVFALSSRVTLGNDVVLRYATPEFADSLLASLRSSGRFFWPVFYTGWLTVFWVLSRELHARVLLALGIAALALQCLDLHRAFDRKPQFETQYATILTHPGWTQSFAEIDTLFAVPPFQHTFSRQGDFTYFGRLGSTAGVPVTLGYAARLPYQAALDYTARLRARVQTARLDPRGLYVLQFPDFVRGFAAASRQGWRGDRWDGYFVLVSPESRVQTGGAFVSAESARLDEYLTHHQEGTILLAAKDEATNLLLPSIREGLAALGSQIEGLAYRGSYVGIFADGRFRLESMQAESPVVAQIEAGQDVGGWIPPRSIRLESAGYLVGNHASIQVDGSELLFPERGFNLVRLNAEGRVVSLGTFDTHADTTGYVVDLQP